MVLAGTAVPVYCHNEAVVPAQERRLLYAELSSNQRLRAVHCIALLLPETVKPVNTGVISTL